MRSLTTTMPMSMSLRMTYFDPLCVRALIAQNVNAVLLNKAKKLMIYLNHQLFCNC